jgi:hypothetical protein
LREAPPEGGGSDYKYLSDFEYYYSNHAHNKSYVGIETACHDPKII